MCEWRESGVRLEACMRARENAKKITDLRQHTEYTIYICLFYPEGYMHIQFTEPKLGKNAIERKKERWNECEQQQQKAVTTQTQ